MREIQSGNFGLIIAYLMPGFIALGGISLFSETIQSWLGTDSAVAPTVGGFFYATLAAIAAGLIINAIRWHIVDPLHYLSGVPKKSWNYSQLPEKVEAFRFLVTAQFRYYECYANTMVAIAFSFAAYAGTVGVSSSAVASFLAVQLVLWSASRKTLLHYHQRVAAFLGGLEQRSDAIPEKMIDLEKPTWYPYLLRFRRSAPWHVIRFRRRRTALSN